MAALSGHRVYNNPISYQLSAPAMIFITFALGA